MDNDYSSGLENPLYSELKYFCRKIQEAYNELKEDLTPYRDDRFYRWVSCLSTMANPRVLALYAACDLSFSNGPAVLWWQMQTRRVHRRDLRVIVLVNCVIFGRFVF